MLGMQRRLENKFGSRRSGDHELVAALLDRTRGKRTGRAGGLDTRRTPLECGTVGRVCDDVHHHVSRLQGEDVRTRLEWSVSVQVPLDLLRLAQLDPVSNLERALRIENDFPLVTLDSGLAGIGARGLSDDSRFGPTQVRFDDSDAVERLTRHPGPDVVISLLTLSEAAYRDGVVVARSGHAQVPGISGQVLAARIKDEAVRIGMHVTVARPPLGHLLLQRQRAMSFGRTRSERQNGGIFVPRRADINDAGILEMMSQWYPRNRSRLQRRIAPDQCPVFLVVALTKSSEPLGDRLRLRIAQARRDAIEDVVVAAQRASRIDTRIVGAFVCARYRSFPDVAEIDSRLSVGKDRVRHVQLPVSKDVAIPEAFARAVLPRIEEVNEPRRGKGPVLEALVVVPIGT